MTSHSSKNSSLHKSPNTIFAFLLVLMAFPALAQEPAEKAACSMTDRTCVIEELRSAADKIENKSWRDQTYRELAKTLAFDGQIDDALAVIDKIETPDTKAMTIRGIGMAVADSNYASGDYDAIFGKLRAEADKITHPPSYAIALTYIAMAQAFAGDNDGAWKTASEMENDALRHKAYGETAEIQAEKGDFEAAMKSITYIDSVAFRNKAYATVSKLLAQHATSEDGSINADQLNAALKAAQKITNDYKRAQALQYVLDIQKPREVEHK